ncbi:glutamine--tRNA ligase/YqeY domain fusion protein [Halopseudomonas aestusnigri]|jgi:glutaminyl-tRNA synthetase|uniref:glutamine--tRNA ligase/YqeY domain fusion protein n=1 Tax=Halopseudomonas TaxID=2901189 RepID=UPI000C894B2D|nr:glutamine--tRNA ligase/YqeY domain fusion protein [Halopseudomonas aestusnigri]MAG99767.1 glutamine--tRNA ligase [Pseudomonadales bacterium]MAP76168.1 glutamine--tRNA ligase [Pseudomonadales bacterium]MCK5533373.1 glutamine--tRNA ligase/YqeY domain fusion protein [Halopseudomonas aestusnigri]UGV32201.1 glutamine--tRNA ligase/YqeY domain fusion protein [Halopseudomonas aestusnigri]|tara:strand:+ start:1940 stop:3607 length:1668 start_codon:yes stop_codon:yes gene_type:complete
MNKPDATPPSHFLRQIVQADLDSGKHSNIVTRFPPEPNGYLHIGHAKSICLNFGLAREFGGVCHLRFDDTNPAKEEQEYIDAIKADVEWLGFEWGGDVRYASDYFDQLHAWAIELIKAGKAYVCELTPEQAREYRGSLTEPGKNSPFRERSVEENLDQFQRMTAGEFADGAKVLRAKIDMAAPNMNLRDPILYRIRHAHHHQTGDKWCVYPSYDFTHGQSDAIEGITHSICTLEFEDHRPLYEWFLDNLPVPAHPRQYEFARLNLNYTVTSKRKLKQLVDEKHVDGWDDPRMSTLSAFRRRGYTPAAIREFCERIGVTRSDGVVDMGVLEFCIRDDLDANAPRAMCVLKPLKVTITNYPEGQTEELRLPRHPKQDMGERVLPFEREIYIDREDFMIDPPKGYKRLEPGGEVRLRGSYVIRADEAVTDADGNIVELLCSYDPDTLGKNPEGRKVKGVIHWVPASSSIECEVRLYDRLFIAANPDKGEEGTTFLDNINPNSLQVLTGCRAEPSLAEATLDDRFQFEREGYFCVDSRDSRPDAMVFNRTVTLRDSWGG